MLNPFLKRATEYLRDEEAFLSVISPEPISYFLGPHAGSGTLYDRLVIIRGTPGSGKTTIARMFELPTISALLRNNNIETYDTLVAALTDAGAIVNGLPNLVAARLPLEAAEYRDFWEFPYPDELKTGLMTTLIQARAVLGWMRNLRSAGYEARAIKVKPRGDAEAATIAIGGVDGESIVTKARSVEAAIYRIVSSLVPPDISTLSPEATGAYHPFDVIDRFEMKAVNTQHAATPLVILDDAHTLAPAQFRALQKWLVRRELRVARWILTRLDILHPGEALAAVTADPNEKAEAPGIGVRREITEILLQSGDRDRKSNRMTFRRMAKDMADRYLRLMPLFSSRRLTSLADLLSTEAEPLSESRLKHLNATVVSSARELRLSHTRVESLRAIVDQYQPSGKIIGEDVRLAMLKILMYRYSKRIAKQRGLFEEEGEFNVEPAKPLSVDSTVYDAARLQLFHDFDRPYHVGIDDLCDAGSENAEQFLRLAAVLVEASSAQLIRSKPASISAKDQNKILQKASGDIFQRWNFPQSELVIHLVRKMSEQCLVESRKPNAWLGAGANAFGIPQAELDELSETQSELARVLQYAVAYNAISLVPRYECKNKLWCLLELGGIPALHFGLTLKRGGFIESTADTLNKLLNEVKE